MDHRAKWCRNKHQHKESLTPESDQEGNEYMNRCRGLGVARQDEVAFKHNLVKSRSPSSLLAFTLTCRLAMLIA